VSRRLVLRGQFEIRWASHRKRRTGEGWAEFQSYSKTDVDEGCNFSAIVGMSRENSSRASEMVHVEGHRRSNLAF